MAITEVGSGSQKVVLKDLDGSNKASVAPAYPGNVTSGSLLIVAGAYANWAGTGQTVGITDTRSTSYTIIYSTEATFASGWNRCFLAYGLAPSGGANTVTVTPSSGNFWISLAIDEFAGGAALALDVDGGESSGTSTTPSDALTTTAAGDLVIGVTFYDDATVSGITLGSGYTELFRDASTMHIPSGAEFKIAGAAGNEAPDWTLGGSWPWRAISVAFKESAGAVGFIPFTRDRVLAQMLAQ